MVLLSLLESGAEDFSLPLRRENGEKTRVKEEGGRTPIKKTRFAYRSGPSTTSHFLCTLVAAVRRSSPFKKTEMKKKKEKESRLFSHVVPAHGQSYNRKRRSLKNPLSFASFLFLLFYFPGTPLTPLLQVQKEGEGKNAPEEEKEEENISTHGKRGRGGLPALQQQGPSVPPLLCGNPPGFQTESDSLSICLLGQSVVCLPQN